MFKFMVTTPDGEQYSITLSEKQQNYNTAWTVRAKSGTEMAQALREEILGSYGAFGHTIGETTTAEDIHAFLASKKNSEGWKFREAGQKVGTYKAPAKGEVF